MNSPVASLDKLLFLTVTNELHLKKNWKRNRKERMTISEAAKVHQVL